MITHIGQYWSARHAEVRLLGAADVGVAAGRLRGRAWDLTGLLPLPGHRRRFREAMRGSPWESVRWTYSRLPLPALELVELAESSGRSVREALAGAVEPASGVPELVLADLDRAPAPDADHLIAPVVPRRAMAFGVTYLNSALEREVEGQIADYGYVYRAVKDRGERPELFIKGTAPEHIVGPNGRMGLRRDLTNSSSMRGERRERLTVSCGIEPELAAVVHSSGSIFGYTLANDVSANRIENESLLYLTQAKHFTGALVLGPLVLLSDEQANPGIEVSTRIFSADGRKLFERRSTSSRINAPLSSLIAWARSHVELTPGEVISTGTDVVPDGEVKVLEEGMTVEIESAGIGVLRHGAAFVPGGGDLNLDHSRLEMESAPGDGG